MSATEPTLAEHLAVAHRRRAIEAGMELDASRTAPGLFTIPRILQLEGTYQTAIRWHTYWMDQAATEARTAA